MEGIFKFPMFLNLEDFFLYPIKFYLDFEHIINIQKFLIAQHSLMAVPYLT